MEVEGELIELRIIKLSQSDTKHRVHGFDLLLNLGLLCQRALVVAHSRVLVHVDSRTVI